MEIHAPHVPGPVPVVPYTVPGSWPDPIPPARFAAHVERELVLGCRVGILGLPDDLGVRLNHGRPGAAQGPSAFRAALARYGVNDPEGVTYPHVLDVGDVMPANGGDAVALAATHERVSTAAEVIVRMGLFPVAIGGGHDLTFAFVRGVARARGWTGPRGTYLDAHLDVRETPGSGMPMRALVEQCGVTNLAVCGMGPLVNAREHTRWFAEHGGEVAEPPEGNVWPVPTALQTHGEVFASLDLDAIDMSRAPGVSALNPQGLSAEQAVAWTRSVAGLPGLGCFDIMELSPPHDEQMRTARLAAHLFLTFLGAWKGGGSGGVILGMGAGSGVGGGGHS